MSRPVMNRAAPEAAKKMAAFHSDVVGAVRDAVSRDPVVVVGMAQNPHVRNVRNALRDAGVRFTYLEYGSYFSGWKPRLAIKMFTGWPTFPQVFVRGTLLGGEDLTKAALADGTLRARMSAASVEADAEAAPAMA